MAVVAELLLEGDNGRELSRSSCVDNAIKSEAERLAAIISASADPVGTMAMFQKLLFAHLAGIQKSAG